MYQVKKQIYQAFSKAQKAALCNFLRALVKKNPEITTEIFVKDEKYYHTQGVPRFEFLAELLDDGQFLRETELFIRECKRFYDYKKSQEPFVQAQKAYLKEKRKQLRDEKMKKEPPTQKQTKYYERLCKKHNLDKMEEEAYSKFSLREAIARILNEHTGDSEDTD